MNFYKLYIKKPNGSYENAIRYDSKEAVFNRIAKMQNEEYLLIWHHDGRDESIEYHSAFLHTVNHINSNIKVNAITFTPEQLNKKKQTKKQKRAEQKRQDYNDFKDYIDR